jgi:hypothetical protein
MEMGLAPAKESCRPLPILESNPVPIMADVRESESWKLGTFLPWEDGDDDAFLLGMAMSIGEEVVGIVKRSSISLLMYCGVGG